MSFDTTPDDEEVIRLAIEQRLIDFNTSLPGLVESYDPKTQTASIQPAIQRKYRGSGLVNIPVLQNVPVVFPRGAQWSISGPLIKGDPGHLIFSQRSLDVWKKSGGVVDPKDTRKFHITDAVFYPGLGPSSKPIAGMNDNLRIVNGTTVFELTPNGKMKFQGTDELITTLIAVTEQIITVFDTLSLDKVNTMMGPQPLLQASAYASAKSAVEALKGKLEGIKE